MTKLIVFRDDGSIENVSMNSFKRLSIGFVEGVRLESFYSFKRSFGPHGINSNLL